MENANRERRQELDARRMERDARHADNIAAALDRNRARVAELERIQRQRQYGQHGYHFSGARYGTGKIAKLGGKVARMDARRQFRAENDPDFAVRDAARRQRQADDAAAQQTHRSLTTGTNYQGDPGRERQRLIREAEIRGLPHPFPDDDCGAAARRFQNGGRRDPDGEGGGPPGLC